MKLGASQNPDGTSEKGGGLHRPYPVRDGGWQESVFPTEGGSVSHIPGPGCRDAWKVVSGTILLGQSGHLCTTQTGGPPNCQICLQEPLVRASLRCPSLAASSHDSIKQKIVHPAVTAVKERLAFSPQGSSA